MYYPIFYKQLTISWVSSGEISDFKGVWVILIK
jgi:hypothetical protein